MVTEAASAITGMEASVTTLGTAGLGVIALIALFGLAALMMRRSSR